MPKVERDGHTLTLKQDQLAYWFAITGNARESALRAGYSESVARVDVYRYLEDPSIKAAIEHHSANLQAIATEEKMTPESVLRGLSYEARAGDTSASRVAAYRSIADILGMTNAGARELPDALNAMLEAVARGLAAGSKQASLPESKVVELPEARRATADEQDSL